MPAAVNSLRSSYRRLEDDRRITARSVTMATTADTAAVTTANPAAAAAGDVTCRDANIRCPHTARDLSRDVIKTQVGLLILI